MPGGSRVQVPHLASEFAERRQVETGKAELDRAGGVEAGVGREVGGKALGQRGQTLGTLLSVVEGRGAG
ncbi:hypothetical protein AA958_22800 [Streptomyces sp. CNQ-509]|nr:hypothetical protein AA958_22800 [Streptomyces sp. CNQ-509]